MKFNFFDKYKLKWKLVFCLLMFTSVLLCILWLFQIVFLDDLYRVVREKEVETVIEIVEQNISSDNYVEILTEISSKYDILIISESEVDEINKLNDMFINNSLIQDLETPMSIFNNIDFKKPEYILRKHEFTDENGNTIELAFQAMLSPVDATVNTLKYGFYFISFFMIIISVILAIIFAYRVSKPIEELNESAKSLSKGNYKTKFGASGFLEVRELSSTLTKTTKQLSKIDDLRKELIANISHDLRTPLGLIYNYAQMIRDFPADIADEDLKVIVDESKRLSNLVDDLLNISQLESGAIEINKRYVNITVSIENIISRIKTLVQSDGYDILFEYSNNIILYVDEAKIEQVFYNLITNAINYSGEEKIVRVIQKDNDNFVRFEVVDTGVGIDESDLVNIWERYYKVDKQHSRPLAGTGLGLSIVKNIVAMHDGRYGVKSTLGVGSVFWIELFKGDENSFRK